MKYTLLLFAIVAFAFAVTSSIKGPTYATTPPTYTKDIYPIFEKRCQICHSSSYPERNWMDYDTAFKNRTKIKARVWSRKDMPMGNATNMTEDERKTVKDWVDAGAPK